MKAAPKRLKQNVRKNRPTLSVGVLRCCAAVFCWRWLFCWVASRTATGDQPRYAGAPGDMRSLRVQEVSTARGMITDRSGRPLAVSVPVKAIWADPKELHDAGGVTWIRAGKRWRMPSICRWISWRRASIPIRGCGLSIWRVRLTLTWPITSRS